MVSADDADTTAPASFAAAEPAAPSPGAPVMGPLVIGDQPVEIASQNDVNALDLAADKTTDAPANAPPINATPNDAAPSYKMAAMSAPAAAVISDTASKSDSIKANLAAPAPEAAQTAVGSPGWFAQVMAALAGAVAAGTIAWFLIGAAPQRTYG
jgi:hypothetical protein